MSVLKTVPGPAQQMVLQLNDWPVLDAVGRENGCTNVLRFEQAVFDEKMRTDEIGVARESGKALIGRIRIPRRSERQNLPPGLPRSHQRVHPAVSFRAEIADAVGARQRSWMQQDAGAARGRSFEGHEPILA